MMLSLWVARDQAGGRRRSFKKKSGEQPMPEITVKGMSCAHCVAAMTKAMESLPGVSRVQVDLAGGQVSYECAAPIPSADLERVVKAAGFELVGV
jgi:copper chaperone